GLGGRVRWGKGDCGNIKTRRQDAGNLVPHRGAGVGRIDDVGPESQHRLILAALQDGRRVDGESRENAGGRVDADARAIDGRPGGAVVSGRLRLERELAGVLPDAEQGDWRTGGCRST